MNEMVRNFGVVPADVALSQDGLTFLKKLIDGEYPAPPIAETLGFTLIEVEHGKAVFEGLPQFRHYNPLGTVHGGLRDDAARFLPRLLRSTPRSARARATPRSR